MKTFKKVISLVLVFAMLASFAGMTGYKYSPMSITADAAFTTGHGAVVRMPLTIYSRYYSDAGVLSSYSSAAGDYLITSEVNEAHGVNLEWYVAPPSGTTGFDVHMRINDTDEWTPLWSGNSGLSITDYPTITRDAGTAQELDYGRLYGKCGVRGNGGFKDVDTVYVRLMLVSASGTTYDYWEVKVINEDKMVEVDMWDTIYKINYAYTMSFPKSGEYATKLNSDDGDYAIPQVDGYNELAYTITFPAGTTGNFSARCSLDNSNWQAGYNTAVPSDLSWERGATTAMQDEYGVLYRDLLWGKGVEGFRDYGRIYWKVEYTCNGNTYTKYWYVNLVDWDKKDSQGVSKQWNGAATSSKPTDSLAGQNTLSNVHVPATLYLNETSVIGSWNNRQGTARRFDTYVMFDVPTGAYDVAVYHVDVNDNLVSTLTWSNPSNSAETGNYGHINNALVSGNTYKWNISGTASEGGVYYRIQYKVDVKDITGYTRTVTYTQYAASYAKALQNHNAVWAASIGRNGSGTGKFKSTFYHEMGFLPALAKNGVDIVVTRNFTSSMDTDAEEEFYYDGSWSFYSHVSGTYGVGYGFWNYYKPSGDTVYFTGGNIRNQTTTGNTIGATVYYDKQNTTVNSDSEVSLLSTANASIGMDSTFTYFKDGEDSGSSNWKWAHFDAFGERWSSDSSFTYNNTTSDGASTLLSSVYSNSSYTWSGTYNLPAGTTSNIESAPSTFTYQYTLNNLQSIPTSLRAASKYVAMSKNDHDYMISFEYGWHLNTVAVDRSTSHTVINSAIACNYVKEEMDSTWWDNYRKTVFQAYVNCGNLTGSETALTRYDTSPVYKFADYSAINTAILTAAPWDRGGKTTDGSNPDSGYIDWGASYEKWNAKTYATDYGKVSGSLAAYDLVFEENSETDEIKFYVSDTPRTGSYYYTTATWNAYTAARDYAVKMYNYPNSTVATFDYDTAYPAKAATDNGNQANIGLACYCQTEIDAAASRLNTKREALVTYDVNNNNYDIEPYYRKLLSQLGSIAYDNSAKQLFDIDTKHGFAGITSEIYDEATILFRANHADDVYSYIWRASENSSETGYAGDGVVVTDADGNPLYCIDDKGTTTKADDETVLASATNPATGEPYDVGILEFPITGKPVGQGNTFSQLMFDNTVDSGYAVDNARLALQNRLRWRMGGGGAAGYEYLGMVEGVYNQEGLTEDNLNDNPTQYFWTGKEHQDDILREIYALYRVKTTLRLAANYRDVVDALNATSGSISVPDYDAEGAKYNEKELHTVTIFQSYTGAWDTVSFTVNNKTYNTTGKTWYTEDTWAGFVADRNVLAAMVYNGSTGTNGTESEIGKDYVYESGLANKYYTYDVKLSSGLEVTNTYYTNGYYQTGGHLAAEYQDDINQAVENYKAWFNGDATDGKELVLKDLDAYTWKAYNETTVSSIEQKVASLYQEIDTTQEFVDFISTTDSTDKTASATLEDKTISLHDPADVTALNALADVVTALHDGGAEGTKFRGTMSLADQHAAFNTALNAFNTKYLEIVDKATPTIVNEDGETVANPNYKPYVDKSSWNDIFTHLTELYGATVDTTTIYDYVELYSNSATVKTAVQTAIQTYNSAVTQSDINNAVEALYNALNTSATSVAVGAAADAAIAYPSQYTFNVYNYTMTAQGGSHDTPSQFTADSVTKLTNTATAAKNQPYAMLETYVSTITAAKTAVEKLTGLASDNNGGVLVYTGAVTTYLETAIAYAESQLYSDVENKVIKTKRVTNPAGDDYVDVPLYSEQSIAELKVTLAEAEAVLAKAESGEYGWDDQIELDKYTFLIYDETEDDTPYILHTNIIASYDSPYTWSTVDEDGNVTKEANWLSEYENTNYAEGLYGARGTKSIVGMASQGLQAGPAYYGFLEAEYKATTVVKTNDGTTTTTDYKGTVWDGEGNLLYTANNVAVGETTFNNWSSYMEYYSQYADLSTTLTIDEQSTVDTLADNIYRTRNALTLSYFPSNTEQFAEATKLFNQLKAYETATTPITRYGYQVDENGNVVYDESGALIAGDATVSGKQYVTVYQNVSEAFINAVAGFEAKYASMSSTEPFDSLNAAQALYNEIYDTYLNPEKATAENLITAKSADHEDFKAGFNDLVDNYIAGTWNEETLEYASNLLNETQVNGLDTALTGAQNVFKTTTNVDATYGTTLAAQTDIVFNYTMTPATDLQFAVAMREQVEEFMALEFTVNEVEFFEGAPTKLPIFNQEQVETFKGDIETFFEDSTKWPAIYEVNGLVAAQAATEVWSVTTYPVGGAESSGTGADAKIDAIIAEVGAESNYYKEILTYTNNYYVDPLAWIEENAFTTVEGETLVLSQNGSTAYTDVLGNSITIAYVPAWNNGYEYCAANGNEYYLYKETDNDSWFQEAGVTTLDAAIVSKDDDVDTYFGGTIDTSGETINLAATKDVVTVGRNKYSLYDITQTLQTAWSKKFQDYLVQAIEIYQGKITTHATTIYEDIDALELRPATEAYREVVNAYFGLQGLKYTWPDSSTSIDPTVATEAELGYEVFYNMAEDTFINKILPEKTYVAATETSPEYGMVAGAGLWTRYGLATYEAGSTNYYDALTTFYTDLIGTTNLVTIDKAAEVYSYNVEDDLDDSLYEKFVAIAQNLKLDDFNREWLDAIVDAFLTGNLDNLQTEDITTLFDKLGDDTPEFESSATETGLYYNASFYTQDSLEAFANVLVQNQIVKNVFVDGELISLTVQNTEAALKEYKGTYYDTAQQIPADDLIKTKLIPSLNTLLVLRAAETAAITTVLDGDDGAEAAMNNESLYVKTYTITDETTGETTTINAWDDFVAAYDNAKAVMAKCNETVTDYYTEAEDSAIITEAANALATALSKLKKRADKSAPQVEVSVDTATVQGFYTNHADEMEEVDTVTSPVSGTLFMPNNGGYSLLVYTNEVNPRIYLNIEDAAEKLTDNTEIAASKKETISVSSKRTSGTVTNLIYGTLSGTGEIYDVVNRNLKADTAKPDTTGPLSNYTNKTIDATDPTKNEDNSSVFAILAPTFNTNSATAAAIYSITIKDDVPEDSGTLFEGDNYSASLVLGDGDPVGVTTTTEKAITVYIYFHNSMADGTDEGIVYGEDGMATLAEPKYGASHVASVLLSGEPSYTGAWRRGLGLTRSFDSSIRSWEFMSEIIDNAIGGVENVAYSDPTFGSLNTGSFYYVLDESDTTDKAIIDTYYGEDNDAAAGLMDYDKATVAKTDMIAKINAMDETEIEAFKTSEGFHEYGATYSRGENKGEYINYAQVLTNKVEKGDLVFVHIVDRWGNVVNRIVEITNLDKVVPVTATTTSGEVTITEEGGSGLKDITVHNGDFSLGSFEYEVSTTQKKLENQQVTNSATVECADNKLTITQLVPGKLYYIGAYDNAGNASSTPVNANADGQITLSITNETTVVETGEDMSLNGSSTFTLNGTDTIILNAGEASSVIDASIEGNVFANRSIRHYITTKDTVTGLKTVYQDGTVEEFTAEDVTVTDNGDGTLKWLIMRKLTEGEHTYNIYAMVDGEYESFYAPATITATSRTVTLTYTISGLGRTVLKYSGSNEIKNSTMDSREIPYGAKVTITAQQSSSSSEFYYWMNSYNERIINTANAYEFTAVTNTNIMAQFTSYESLYEGKKLVIYVNNAKNVIKAFELADGDTYTVPTGPVLPDYTFKGWSMTKAEVLASDKDTIIVEPIYELNASNTVTITEGNYTATGAGTYTAEDNQRAVVTISTSVKDDDGNEFLYWIDADTSEIVSYERTYSFFCVKDTELTPVYGDASTVTAEPIVRITEVKFNALSGKVSFFAERSVPEEFTILQTGIVVTKTESIGTNEEVFVVGGTSTAAGTSTSTANNGYYSASAAVATGQTVWARAYAIYETADGEIFEAYGPVVSYTVD